MHRVICRVGLCLLLFVPLVVSGQDGHRVAPGTVEVLTTSAADGKPVRDLPIRIGGRRAHTGPDGVARFEGIPEGEYVLAFAQPGYEEIVRKIDLPPGRRERIALTVKPTTFVTRTLKVVTAGTGVPIAGTEILLTPKAVAESARGPIEATTRWDGTSVLFQVPAGTWNARVTATGHHALEKEIELVAGKAEIPLEMRPVVETVGLSVSVTDAVTGAAIDNAAVTVAECWPAGKLAETRANAGGVAEPRFETAWHLKRVTVHAVADGYEANVVPARLGAGGKVAIALTPIRKVAEAEPNQEPGTAQEITTGTTVELTIEKNDDVDFFVFRLALPARVRVVLSSHAVLQRRLHVYRTATEEILRADAWPKDPIDRTLDLPAGRYLVSVEEWGRDTASEDPLTLTVTAVPAVDPYEDNDRLYSAKKLELNSTASGLLFPLKDRDHFRFEMPRPGRIRVFVEPNSIQQQVSILDRNGNVVARGEAWDRKPIDRDWQLPAGRYVLRLNEWGEDSKTLDPWRIRLQAILDGEIEDRPVVSGRRPAAERVLEPGTRVGGTISHVEDTDLFAVPIPSRGRLHVAGCGLTQVRVRLFDGRGRALDHFDQWDRKTGALTAAFESAGVAYVEMREWGDDAWSASPYQLWAWFVPSDELDLLLENDDPLGATPIEVEETVRGSFLPVEDQDHYRVLVDHPGWLHIHVESPLQISSAVIDGKGGQVAGWNDWPGAHEHSLPVLPGAYLVRLGEWGADGESPSEYTLRTELRRADPAETVPLANDPVRTLRLGHAASLRIEQRGDRDRFVFDVPAKGPFFLRIASPVQKTVRVTDARTGAMVFDRNEWPGNHVWKIEAAGPTRYRLEVHEWGNDAWSLEPGWVLVDSTDRQIPGERVEASVDRHDPTNVAFARRALEGVDGAQRVSIDADGDGRDDLDAPGSYRYAQEGVYPARVTFHGANGVTSESTVWVTAQGPRERKGLHLAVSAPAEGQVVTEDLTCRAHAMSFSGARITRVGLSVDGRPVGRSVNAPHEFDLPWTELGSGEHELVFSAVDAKGEKQSLTRRVRVSDYFGLRPAEGAVVTGDRVRVSWTGPTFGAARVRYRKQGDAAWIDAVGPNSRLRQVDLRGLEPGAVYEFQPLGGTESGPVRTVTRVKGLAFGSDVYSATVERDYDQRVSVSVRNHGEKPLTLSLRAGRPGRDLLLVGFVGEGSQGAPFDLQPGEERDFMLGISAQDVIRPDHAFPIFIESDTGLSDEAEVRLRVKLPVVKLRWEEMGRTGDGLGYRFRLHNEGDALTDLALGASDGISVSPALEHGLLRKHQRLDVRVTPVLHEGFRSIDGTFHARAVGETVEQPVAMALPPGESVFKVRLTPGAVRVSRGEKATEEDLLMEARAMAGAHLNPVHLDWSKPDRREEHRLVIEQDVEMITWYGEDTDGDGTVDHVTADVGGDGQIDYSGVLIDGVWERTPIVDSWLEMGFGLPWSRTAYEPHDLDVIVNDRVVGELRDSVPEGNYRFRLPIAALGFDGNGAPTENTLAINSKHLRGGHYVVNSDFQLKVRLTDTQVFVAAKDEKQALERAAGTEGMTFSGPDFSVSSQDLYVEGAERLEKGKVVVIHTTLRNVGAANVDSVAVSLFRATPGHAAVELTREYVNAPSLMGGTDVALRWSVAPGNHLLKVVVDPDGECGDTNPLNNEAVTTLSVPGDDAPPTVEVLSPKADSESASSVLSVEARAKDDSGIAKVEVKVDRGLFAPLTREGDRWVGRALAQPGARTLTIRATDSGGNHVEESVSVTITSEAPTVTILKPAAGAKIDGDRVEIQVEAGDGAATVAVRVNGGPWTALARDGGRIAACTLPIRFGPGTVDAMAVGPTGARGTASVNVDCTHQPTEAEEAAPEVETPPDTMDPDDFDLPEGVAPEDLLGEPNRAIPPARTPGGRGDGGGREGGGGTAGGANATGGGNDTGGAAGGRDTARGDGERAGGDEAGAGGDEAGGEEAVADGPGAHAPAADGAATGAGRNGAATRNRGRAAPGRSRGRARGGQVGYQRNFRNWYCTNRPKIKSKFRLPDWLRKLKLPKPGDKDFREKMIRFKVMLRMKGINPDRFFKFQESLKRRIDRMDQHDGDLPGFLESLGFGAGPKPKDPKKLREWRESLKNKADAWFLRLLASGDERLIAAGLKARAEQIGAFDEASQMHAQACIDEIKANQQITQDVLEALPYVGEAVDLITAWNGETLSGEKIGGWERFFRVACAAGPAAFEEALKRSPKLQRAMASFVDAAGNMASGTKNALLEAAGVNVKKFDDVMGAVGNFLTKERHLFKSKADDALRQADNAYKAGADGIEELKKWDGAAKQSQKSLDEVGDMAAKGKKLGDPDLEAAVLKVQQDKLAQNIINQADETANATADTINKTMNRIYDDVDDATVGALRKSKDVDEQIKAFAKKHGVDPDDVKIKKWEPTNTKAPSDKVGVPRDRDVTFQLEADVGGKKIASDIDYRVSEKVYNDEFYKRCKGKAPASADEAADFAHQMDQTVTSKSHLEAYNLGDEDVAKLLDGKQPTITKPEDFRDVVIHKSDHWFKKAQDAAKAGDAAQASKDMAEGMRQCNKQYKNFAVPRAKMYGATVPPHIEKTMEIFKKVEKIEISPGQAEVMLKKLGELSGSKVPLTPMKAVEDVAHFIEGLEKGAGKTFKTLKATELATQLKKMKAVDQLGDSMTMINRAVKEGKITHAKFFELRKTMLTLPPSATSTAKETFRRWAIRQAGKGALSPQERAHVEKQVGPLEEK